jgi:hypothetical protein
MSYPCYSRFYAWAIAVLVAALNSKDSHLPKITLPSRGKNILQQSSQAASVSPEPAPHRRYKNIAIASVEPLDCICQVHDDHQLKIKGEKNERCNFNVICLIPTKKKTCNKLQFRVHHANGAPSGASTPSGCCSPTKCGHPRAAFQRKSNAVDQGGFPPCPGSWP